MDTTIILGITALVGILFGVKALKEKNKPQKKKPSTAPTPAETAPKPAPSEEQAVTAAEQAPLKPAPSEEQAVTTAETPPKPAPSEEQAVTPAETPPKPAPLEEQTVTPAEETPPKPAPLEEQAVTPAETPPKPAPSEEQAVTTAEPPPKQALSEEQAVTPAEPPPKPAPSEEQAVTPAETPPKPAALEETTESPPLPETCDDIFISHNCTSQEMVEILAHNLDKIGYRVFSDNWETSPKQTDNSTANTLPNDSQAILIITPEAIESGWVREEYESMLKRQQNDPDFTFVPVSFNDALSDSPFLSDIELVNFSTEKYPEAFHRLVSVFGEKSFDDKDLELPPPFVAPTAALPRGTREFIQTRFDHFKQNSPPPLMLLAQSDRSQAPLLEALLTEAKTRYNRCLHIALPYSTAADTQDSFSVLAQQCEFSETVNNGVEFEQALLARLKNQSNQPNPLFLLVSRFEHGAQSTRQQLAGIVRSLNESHADQVHIILCGGEKLVELKYRHGSHSLLNIAQEYHWPELERADVYAMRDNCCQDLVLDDEDADKLLNESGRRHCQKNRPSPLPNRHQSLHHQKNRLSPLPKRHQSRRR
jgi:cell division protein FtsN